MLIQLISSDSQLSGRYQKAQWVLLSVECNNLVKSYHFDVLYIVYTPVGTGCVMKDNSSRGREGLDVP